ncbi:MAG: hypothetical protein WCR52_01410 [Bacteroidota bacterium]
MKFTLKSTLIPILLLSCGLLSAQHKQKIAGPLTPEAAAQLKGAEDTLALLAYAVVNDSIERERFAACKVLITKLVKTLKIENSFSYKFDRLNSISIITSPDSSFRIFTWQLFVNDSTYKYYGAIQMNQPDLKLYPIMDRSAEMDPPPISEPLDPEKWYGALYYTLRQFDTKEGRKYLLIGYNGYSFFTKRKVIDVLSFDKTTGKPVFGAPVFKRAADYKGPVELRLYFDYSADSGVRVNWDEAYGMILLDHLIPIPSPYGRGTAFVTDGSYDALKLEKGKWKFIDKVFNDVQDKAPFPEPVLDSRKGKDIMGKPQKPRKGI